MNKTSALAVGLVVSGFVYLNGFKGIGLIIAGFSLLIFFTSALTEKPEQKSSSLDYKMGNEIIIESERQLPYRVPEKMVITYKGDAGQKKPWWKKVTGKGIFAYVGKKTGESLKKLKEGE